MNMRLMPLLAVVAMISFGVRAQVPQTNKPAAKTPPGSTAKPATAAPKANAVNVVTNKVAEPPADQYTNVVGMELVKVGGYWAGRYEVTQKEYQEIMGSNPSQFSGEKHPVDNVCWNDAVEFCRRLTEADIAATNLPPNYHYTLPTEDQWEAMVADSSLADAVTSQAGPRSGTALVGTLKPNGLGLYDVRGNVMEFTLGDTSKPYRVLRGSSWQDWIEINLRTAFRNYCPPDERKNTYGFRCVLIAPAK
jgi:formylglycine-generating enzyme required for sulfatase activity